MAAFRSQIDHAVPSPLIMECLEGQIAIFGQVNTQSGWYFFDREGDKGDSENPVDTKFFFSIIQGRYIDAMRHLSKGAFAESSANGSQVLFIS